MDAELKDVVEKWILGLSALLALYCLAWALGDAMMREQICLNNPVSIALFVLTVLYIFSMLYIAIEMHVRIVLWAIEKHKEVKQHGA